MPHTHFNFVIPFLDVLGPIRLYIGCFSPLQIHLTHSIWFLVVFVVQFVVDQREH